jgi:hypothetical protein
MKMSEAEDGEKTKPNKPNIEQSRMNFTYNTEDCHGPSGLAMTDRIYALLCFLWLLPKLKKQSQFRYNLRQGGLGETPQFIEY